MDLKNAARYKDKHSPQNLTLSKTFLPCTLLIFLCSDAALLIQPLYLFTAFGADGIADVVPEGGVELGVIALSSEVSLISYADY